MKFPQRAPGHFQTGSSFGSLDHCILILGLNSDVYAKQKDRFIRLSAGGAGANAAGHTIGCRE